MPSLLESLVLGVPLALLFVASLWIYSSHTRSVLAPDGGHVRADNFGIPDLVIASILVAWFALTGIAGFMMKPASVTTGALMAGLIVFAAILATIVWVLRFQKISFTKQFGLDRPDAGRFILHGVGFLLAAYPLIAVAGWVGQQFARSVPEPQEMVSFFLNSEEPGARLLVIAMAVIVAPIAEETIFRGYIYGVAKRYFGMGAGIVINGALFALVHQYLPGVGVYFILAACLTIAYEKSGSLLVPMTMHAVFNAVSLSFLTISQPGI